MIDWKPVQRKLGLTPDGIAGRMTFGALFGHVAARPLDPLLLSLGNAAVIHLNKYGFTSPKRLSWVLAETENETGGYRRFDENLNYRTSQLMKMWPRHFNEELVVWASGNPERIAEVAYGVKSKTGKGRMGNDQPGDGYKYRGRGMLQLTGKDNYERYDRLLGLGLDCNPELAAVPALSLLIACEFYAQGGVMKKVDVNDLPGARLITNGGAHGLPRVTANYHKMMAVLS